MIKKIFLSFTTFLLTLSLYSINFEVNGSLWKEYADNELKALSYTIPFQNRSYRGISLDELFPAVFEAWEIKLKSASSEIINLTGPGIGKNLSRIFIINDNNSWSLLYNNRIYTKINSLGLECEILDKSPIEIWINWEGKDLLRSEIKRYAEMHNIEIKVTEVPKPDSKLVSVSQAMGSVPDIIMVQSSYIYRLAKSGTIQNIDYMYPEGMVPQGREAFRLSGKTWAVPFYYDAQMLFYNPEIIDKPQNEWTLTDFETLCSKAAQKGVIPSAWNSYSASFLIPFQFAFGKSRLIEDDYSIIIDDKPTLEALSYILKLQKKGLMQPMERDAMTSLFVSGKAAMIISASYSIPHFEELGIQFGAVPLPINEKTNRRVAPLLDFKAFAIPKRSKNTSAAGRLIEYLCGIGVQQRFIPAVSKLPALESAWSVSADQNPWYETLKISSNAGIIIPTAKAYSVYKNTMWKMLRFAISGRMPAEQVLKKTQELVNKNLEDLKQ